MVRKTAYANLTGLVLIPLMLAGCDMAMPYRNAPVSQGQVAQPHCPASMTVERGDTVYSLSRRCGVSVRALIETNALQAPYELTPGSVLRMPGAMTEIVVAKGDTLSKLARRYAVDFQSLAQANNKSPPYTIRVGEHLRLPGAYGQSAALPQTPAAGAQPGAVPQGTTVAVVNAEPLAPPPARPGTFPATAATTGPATAATSGNVITSPNAALPEMALPPPPRPAAEAAAPVALSSSPSQPTALQPTAPQPAPRQVAVATPMPEPPPVSAKGFIWPVKGEVILGYGPQTGKGQSSDGINIAAPRGTPIHAIESGVVAYVGNELKGFGNLILIKHADGWVSAYAHADQVLVKKGEVVRKGQELGTVGQTGSVNQPQLHFELRHQNEAVDPQEYLPG